ncbi:hypothetical protein [Salipiger sp. PrR003]|uniref:hypothetical protein n=1 Tax=Salipiger sp. PrR003 TaxID=2706776 RepID=UPI0013DAF2AF|nr:hypothetical protein [Salipiger sp. PrR003]NDV52151.1 hypothetical protein [Salipiger sp. PrR003]NDV52177.1 hypothetical protein [Salipiger sp. PrR003]
MANRPATFKQSDVTRAARGVTAAGLPVVGVEIDREGKIIIRCAESDGKQSVSAIDKALGIE